MFINHYYFDIFIGKKWRNFKKLVILLYKSPDILNRETTEPSIKLTE